jgi:hypothetical protein
VKLEKQWAIERSITWTHSLPARNRETDLYNGLRILV